MRRRLRLRILRMCLDEPLTNAQIAARLDRDPATVLHHVRTLTGTGFLEALPAQKGNRGAQDRAVPIDPEILDDAGRHVEPADDRGLPGVGGDHDDDDLDVTGSACGWTSRGMPN